jgi:hypothetical protein
MSIYLYYIHTHMNMSYQLGFVNTGSAHQPQRSPHLTDFALRTGVSVGLKMLDEGKLSHVDF